MAYSYLQCSEADSLVLVLQLHLMFGDNLIGPKSDYELHGMMIDDIAGPHNIQFSYNN